MDQITLNGDLCCDALVIPGAAVERCLREANESQLKIYLYLLKNGADNATIDSIADYFNYSEQDVKRALKFWNGGTKSRAAKNTAGGNIVEFSRKPDVDQLMFVAEQYMKRPIKQDEVRTILYIYDELAFPADLIEYLLEYCISNKKRSFKSIEAMESVAVEWKEAGVTTLEDAKRLTRRIPKEMNDVMRELGFPKDHQPVEAEIAFVRRWTERYGYGMDIIGEACKRTVLATCKPSIRYANGILKQWHDAKVEKPEDIIALDEEYRKKSIKTEQKKTTTTTAGKFHNFSERKIDYDSLRKDVLSN